MTMGKWDTHQTGPLSTPNEKAARAAMGIPDEARVIPMNLSHVPLFVVVQAADDGGLDVQAMGTMPKRQAAEVMRHIAEVWEAADDDEA